MTMLKTWRPSCQHTRVCSSSLETLQLLCYLMHDIVCHIPHLLSTEQFMEFDTDNSGDIGKL